MTQHRMLPPRHALLLTATLLGACTDDGGTSSDNAASAGAASSGASSGGAAGTVGALSGGAADTGGASSNGGASGGAASSGGASSGGASSGGASSGGASSGGASSGGASSGGASSGGASSGGASSGGASSGGAYSGGASSGGAPDTGGAGGAAGATTAGSGGEPASGGAGAGGAAGFDGELAPTSEVTFTESTEDFSNPERGFYRYVNLTSETDLSWVADDGTTLVYSYVRLDDYRDAPIAQSLLDDMNTGLAAVRDAGLKAIVRFAYNFGPYPDSEPDASKARILEHIGQVEPHLRANADVIAVMQAGFIGAWAEWHTSTNGLLDEPQDRKDIHEALLDAIPTSRMSQVRYPPYVEEMYGGPLTAAEAFSETYAARTGHHNDCFLSSDTDVGTYPSSEVEEWKAYLEEDTKYVPMGGETCELHDRGICPTATAEMERLHWTYLNRDYNTDVIDRWITDGCYDEISRSLGYRFALRDASVPPAVQPGGAFLLEVTLDNVGWAALFNPRPVQVVLDGPGGLLRVEVATLDPRRWLPGTINLRVRVDLPSNLAAGDYTLGLALPDAAASLTDRSAYAVRFANEGVWQSAGYNQLATVSISTSAPGDAAPDTTELRAVLQP